MDGRIDGIIDRSCRQQWTAAMENNGKEMVKENINNGNSKGGLIPIGWTTDIRTQEFQGTVNHGKINLKGQ